MPPTGRGSVWEILLVCLSWLFQQVSKTSQTHLPRAPQEEEPPLLLESMLLLTRITSYEHFSTFSSLWNKNLICSLSLDFVEKCDWIDDVLL